MRLTWFAVLTSVVKPQCSNKRIVGGQSIDENGSPFSADWIVSMSMGCGGSWISENYVLTAAHCFPNRKLDQSDVWELFGKDGDGRKKILGNITGGNVIVHEEFNPITMVNDIALVKICDEISHTIIKIPDVFVEYESYFVYGWGTMKYGEANIPDILQWVETPYKRVGINV